MQLNTLITASCLAVVSSAAAVHTPATRHFVIPALGTSMPPPPSDKTKVQMCRMQFNVTDIATKESTFCQGSYACEIGDKPMYPTLKEPLPCDNKNFFWYFPHHDNWADYNIGVIHKWSDYARTHAGVTKDVSPTNYPATYRLHCSPSGICGQSFSNATNPITLDFECE